MDVPPPALCGWVYILVAWIDRHSAGSSRTSLQVPLQGLHRGASGVLARRVQDDTRVAPARLLLLLALILSRA
jgi:hypothetical protein